MEDMLLLYTLLHQGGAYVVGSGEQCSYYCSFVGEGVVCKIFVCVGSFPKHSGGQITMRMVESKNENFPSVLVSKVNWMDSSIELGGHGNCGLCQLRGWCKCRPHISSRRAEGNGRWTGLFAPHLP